MPNGDGMLVPGSRVRVRLTIGKPYAAMLVPDTAILSDQSKRYVLVVDDKKTVRRRDVTLGALTDDGLRAIQPADKLAEGENVAQWEVVVDNLQRARLNYPVEAESAGARLGEGKKLDGLAPEHRGAQRLVFRGVLGQERPAQRVARQAPHDVDRA